MTLRPFHLAFPVTDLEKTKEFYTNVFECSSGRESERWVDFDLYGHQLTAHLVDNMPVVDYIHPDRFEFFRDQALLKGFREVESSPLVRSSYHADLQAEGLLK